MTKEADTIRQYHVKPLQFYIENSLDSFDNSLYYYLHKCVYMTNDNNFFNHRYKPSKFSSTLFFRTRSLACLKSSAVTCILLSLNANKPASVHMA